ncbi:MAG: kynureninase [Ilumatobacteraceae bacterium]
MTTGRDDAEALDREDPLAAWREEFLIAEDAPIYLDGNSLGMTPRRTVAALRDVVEKQWAGDLITSWWEHAWIDMPLAVGDLLAPLIGARPGEVAVHDSTTVCLFQLVNVALDLRPGRRVIAVADEEFPTDRYIVDGVARLRGCDVRHGLDDLRGVDVVVRSLVDYRTAELTDLAGETARAEAEGATTVWDLSHAVGAVEVDLGGAGAVLAAGCTYKFLNGGPGSPAFTYVASALHDRIEQPIWGWFGQTDQFAMERPFEPRPGIARLLNGTPGVLGMVGAREGIVLTAEAGIEAIAAKGRSLTGFGLDHARASGLETTTPLDPERRGAHVAVRHPDAERLHAALEEQGIIVDRRDPDILRLGMSPLTTRFVDVHDAITTLASLA